MEIPKPLRDLAARLAACDPAAVLAAARRPDGSLAAVIDRGIAGSPKLIFTAEQVAQVITAAEPPPDDPPPAESGPKAKPKRAK